MVNMARAAKLVHIYLTRLIEDPFWYEFARDRRIKWCRLSAIACTKTHSKGNDILSGTRSLFYHVTSKRVFIGVSQPYIVRIADL